MRISSLMISSLFSVIAVAAMAEPPAQMAGSGMEMPPQMQERMRQHLEQKLKETDANADGKISREEFMRQAESRFNKADLNGDGEITQEEFAQMRDRMRPPHHGGKQHGNMPPTPPAVE
jgi:Ca2+-binding EF-hand superfamily protein